MKKKDEKIGIDEKELEREGKEEDEGHYQI